jgi:hypothetical protein
MHPRAEQASRSQQNSGSTLAMELLRRELLIGNAYRCALKQHGEGRSDDESLSSLRPRPHRQVFA